MLNYKATNSCVDNLGITLLELAVVVVLFGIIVGLILPGHYRRVERLRDKEARQNLEFIRTAEMRYMSEQNYTFYPPYGTTVYDDYELQNALLLNLTNNSGWDYEIEGFDGFRASAHRVGSGYDRTWMINSSMHNATCLGPQCP